MGTLNKDSPIEIRITPVSGKDNIYKIQSVWGCDDNNEWCDAKMYCLWYDSNQDKGIAVFQ